MSDEPFSRFLSEIKRRKVARVAVVYAIVGWAVVQFVETVAPMLLLPEWTPRLVLVFVLVGFPLTLIAAWAFEITAEGVRRTEPSAAPLEETEGPASRLTGVLLVLAVVAMAALGGYYWGSRGPAEVSSGGDPIRSLAVLPLDNLTGDEAQAYFVDGMHDALIAELGRLEQLTVLSRTSTLRYRDTELSMGEIARELGVEGLIEGSVFRAGDSVRITVQLVRGTPEEHLWTDSYRGDLSHALSLQSRVARSIADAIRLTLTPEQQSRLAGGGGVDPRAQDAYLQGRALWRTRLLPNLERAVRLMEEAVALDSSFARGWAGLADALLIYTIYDSSPRDSTRERVLASYDRSREAARRALRLDPDLAEARATLGYAAMFADLDWAQAERRIRRALELSPNYAQGWNWLSNVLTVRGRTGEAVRAGEKAVQLDPFSPLMHRDLGLALMADGRCEDAVPRFERALELDPNHMYAYLGLGGCSIRRGAAREGVEYFRLALQQWLPGADDLVGEFREAFETGGLEGWARLALELDLPVRGRDRAWAYTVLGRFDEAVATLRSGFENRDPSVILAGRPFIGDFPELREHPGYKALMRDVGLAD